MTRIILTLLLLFPQVGAANSLNENTGSYPMLNITAGQIGVADSIEEPNQYGIEFQANSFRLLEYDIIPAFGYTTSEGGTEYAYVSFRYDYWLDDNWVLTPIWGVGYFEDSEEIILGHELEFVSGLELAYQFEHNVRLGLMVSHLSNAGISSTNPGTETVVFSLSIPLGD